MEFRKTRFEKHLEAVEREEERWGRGEGGSSCDIQPIGERGDFIFRETGR